MQGPGPDGLWATRADATGRKQRIDPSSSSLGMHLVQSPPETEHGPVGIWGPSLKPFNPLDAAHSVPGHPFIPAQVLQDKICHGTMKFQVQLLLFSLQIPQTPAVILNNINLMGYYSPFLTRTSTAAE